MARESLRWIMETYEYLKWASQERGQQDISSGSRGLEWSWVQEREGGEVHNWQADELDECCLN